MMATTTQVTCDGCGKDITYTGNSVDYRLVLDTQAKTPWYVREGKTGGPVTDWMQYPPISRRHHFCGLNCLDAWRTKPVDKPVVDAVTFAP